ncbi:DUF6361 family protein [Thioalkalivibrio nitratireducens]|nr:DUF6361 family protein [Thioalkalivibrio nitratireducens]
MDNAYLHWLDLTAADRDKARKVLDLFNEQGTVDELGLGSLRDVLSNALFPGTSVLHTRLRYVLFIPWVYQQLEARHGNFDVASEARRLEVTLIDALATSDAPEGIIGVHAREAVARLASSAYWAALVHWGLFVPAKSQGWYHAHFHSLRRRRSDYPRTDDPGVIWTQEATWHPRLPPAPDAFPEDAAFALTPEEADFLLGRLEATCNGTLLAWLAREGSSSPAEYLWEDPEALRGPPAICDVVELARRFSRHVEGAPLLYNLLLAELRRTEHDRADDEEWIEHYRDALAEWANREADEDAFDPEALWHFVRLHGAHLPTPQQRFVETWSRRVAMNGPDGVVNDEELRRLIADRERQLKGPRARVVNQGRLLDWRGNVGVGRMQFRWPQVRRLLIDLHKGLGH